ncbi:hypothetical protein VHEMI00547 [[Torrubiella] hemipterigena]|uniref:Uncharacterized protein n=1 Tax=[Torrubiella] hemipterigena TaxID=1531966 RepID=A0A0A1T283_9HYPO|nr:hypothetical protein VHEMI00547 [[Torrubiella] hemipterigena]
MALINPVHAAIVPFLCIVTVPLALFAGLTTTLAFSVLICRVIVVYLDIAISLINNSFGSFKIQPHMRQVAALDDDSQPPTRVPSSAALPAPRRRRRRPSSVSILTGGTVTPVNEAGLGLTPSIGAWRDYEGVGGWRVGDQDDEIWTTINSRFELPDRQHRHHHRTPSGGPTTPGADGGFLMMKRRNRSPDEPTGPKTKTSPNSSRTRTPSVSRMSFSPTGNPDGYFPLSMSTKASAKKASASNGTQ